PARSVHTRRRGEALPPPGHPGPHREKAPGRKDRDKLRVRRRTHRTVREAQRQMRVKADGATLNGFIDKGSHFQGDLSFEETFRIDGRFEGRIRSGSELIVGEGAEVSAEIEVERISVNGTLRGSVQASGRIELLARAR